MSPNTRPLSPRSIQVDAEWNAWYSGEYVRWTPIVRQSEPLVKV